jgi:hypothetical protein
VAKCGCNLVVDQVRDAHGAGNDASGVDNSCRPSTASLCLCEFRARHIELGGSICRTMGAESQ